MYFTDRGIEELEDRRGSEEVSLGWLAEQLRVFVDLNRTNNTTSETQNPASFGVVERNQATASGFLAAHFNGESRQRRTAVHKILAAGRRAFHIRTRLGRVRQQVAVDVVA